MKAETVDTLKIAVTGGAGSGKTSVCNHLRALGLKVFSSDALAREAVAPETPAYKNIVNYFGNNLLLNDGTLNRQQLRRIIVNDDAARSVLESFIHPEITRLLQLKLAEARQDCQRLVWIEVPLLFEFDMQDQFDVVVLVFARREVRIQRLMERDGVTRKEAAKLIDVQMPDENKVKQADFVINNEGTVEQLIKSVNGFYKKIDQKYGKKGESA